MDGNGVLYTFLPVGTTTSPGGLSLPDSALVHVYIAMGRPYAHYLGGLKQTVTSWHLGNISYSYRGCFYQGPYVI